MGSYCLRRNKCWIPVFSLTTLVFTGSFIYVYILIYIFISPRYRKIYYVNICTWVIRDYKAVFTQPD